MASGAHGLFDAGVGGGSNCDPAGGRARGEFGVRAVGGFDLAAYPGRGGGVGAGFFRAFGTGGDGMLAIWPLSSPNSPSRPLQTARYHKT